jgi:hypothetical protein
MIANKTTTNNPFTTVKVLPSDRTIPVAGRRQLAWNRLFRSNRQVHQVILVACSDLSRNRQTDNEQRQN